MRTAGGAQVNDQVSEQLSVWGTARKPLQLLLSMPALTQLLNSAQPFSTTEMAAVLGVSPSSALRYVGLLMQAGCLQKQGKGPHTRYKGTGSLPGVSSSGEAVEEKASSPAEGEPPYCVDGRALDELLLRQKGLFTAKEVALQASVHVSTVLRHIHRLGKTYLKQVGAGPKTKYRVRTSAQSLSKCLAQGYQGQMGNRGKGAHRACSGQRQEESPVNAPPLEDLGPALKRGAAQDSAGLVAWLYVGEDAGGADVGASTNAPAISQHAAVAGSGKGGGLDP
ncbi:MAG: hypothetical protein ACKO6N_02280 [Myxococcota bacterium]